MKDYIKKIIDYAQNNPSLFWSDAGKQTRLWLYNNGYSSVMKEIYKNTPKEIRKTISYKKLPKETAISAFQEKLTEQPRSLMSHVEESVIKPIGRKFAYNIVANPNVGRKAGANKEDVMNGVLNTLMGNTPPEDTNKYMFIFGGDARRPRTTTGQGFDWNTAIKNNGYENVNTYKGVLNPFNEYIIDERNRGLVEALADARYTPGISINDEYMNVDGTPYYDDVHSYRARFHYDKDGNPTITATDLYDFGGSYSENYSDVYKERGGTSDLGWQVKALNYVGQPYRLAQHNIPIKYVSNPTGQEYQRMKAFEDLVLNRLSDKDIAKYTDTGYIEPATIAVSK